MEHQREKEKRKASAMTPPGGPEDREPKRSRQDAEGDSAQDQTAEN